MAQAYKALPPASELWELFDYKPLTGELVRKDLPQFQGTVTRDGYTSRMVNRSIYRTHRLVWKWVYAQGIIDHKDRNPSNDRIWNLRMATPSENMRNRRNTKGYYKDRDDYRMAIVINGKRIRRRFKTEAEARAAYEKASLELHGEFSAVGVAK